MWVRNLVALRKGKNMRVFEGKVAFDDLHDLNLSPNIIGILKLRSVG